MCKISIIYLLFINITYNLEDKAFFTKKYIFHKNIIKKEVA